MTSGISGLENDLWEYDPLKDTWALQDLSEYPARAQAVGFSIGDCGFIGTGLNLNGNHLQQDFWKFTIKTGGN